MKSLSQMSPRELRELADKKEQEDKIFRQGFLKHDLFVKSYQSPSKLSEQYEPLTLVEKEALIKAFANSFELIIAKGSKFVSYKNLFGRDCESFEQELWYDDIGYGLEDMSADWAEKNLENITEVKNEQVRKD